MITYCPVCAASMSLDVLIAHDEAREYMQQLFSIDERLGRKVTVYLGLFRPLKTKRLSFGRMASLLSELLPFIQAQKIMRNGHEYSAPVEAWVCAIDQILANRTTLILPFKSHGYLFEVLSKWQGQAVCVPAGQTTVTKQPQNLSQSKKSLLVLDEIARQITGGSNG